MRKTPIVLGLALVGSIAFAKDAGPPETKAQRAHRSEYIAKTLKHEREIVGHHAWTPEMNAAASGHWKNAYRAIRIHELAEDDHDAAAMKRADAVLDRLDERFFKLLPT